MKQDINLMPPKEKHFKKAVISLLTVLLILVAATAVAYWFIVRPLLQKDSLTKELESYQQTNARYEAQQQELTEVKARLEQIQQQMELMDPLLNQERTWSELLMLIDAALPNDVVVQSLDFWENSITLSGSSGLDDRTLALAVNQLRAIDVFYDVDLLSYYEQDGTQYFEISVELEPIALESEDPGIEVNSVQEEAM